MPTTSIVDSPTGIGGRRNSSSHSANGASGSHPASRITFMNVFTLIICDSAGFTCPPRGA